MQTTINHDLENGYWNTETVSTNEFLLQSCTLPFEPDQETTPDEQLQELEPKSLSELLHLKPENLDRVDIGRMNLLCSSDLPQTKNLDIEIPLYLLDKLAETAIEQLESDKNWHLFDENQAEFENSEPFFLMFLLVRYLKFAIGYTYPEEERDLNSEVDWNKTNRRFIYGLLQIPSEGTCASLPVLVVAVGRRIGLPLNLVHSPGHVFCRWDGLEHQYPEWQEVRIFEVSNDINSYSDEEYHHHPIEWWPSTYEMEKQRGENRLYLRSLIPPEILASFLVLRAYALEARCRFDEAILVYNIAIDLAPRDDSYVHFRKRCAQKHVEHMLLAQNSFERPLHSLFEPTRMNQPQPASKKPKEYIQLGPYRMQKTDPLPLLRAHSVLEGEFAQMMRLSPYEQVTLAGLKRDKKPQVQSTCLKKMRAQNRIDFSYPEQHK